MIKADAPAAAAHIAVMTGIIVSLFSPVWGEDGKDSVVDEVCVSIWVSVGSYIIKSASCADIF